jgi:hypothetical protein
MPFVTTEIASCMDSQVTHVLLKVTHRMRRHASKVTHLLLTAEVLIRHQPHQARINRR